MKTTRFKCSLDVLSLVLSGLILLLAIAMFVSPDYIGSLDIVNPGPVAAGVFLLALCLVMFAFMPRALEVGPDGIRVCRILFSRQFNRKDIIALRKAEPGEMKWAYRTFGNGGLFGYTGYYQSSIVGSMLWYCTRRSNYILVIRSQGPVVVITPDDPEGFLAQYNSVSAA